MPTTPEAEIQKTVVQCQPQQKVLKTPYQSIKIGCGVHAYRPCYTEGVRSWEAKHDVNSRLDIEMLCSQGTRLLPCGAPPQNSSTSRGAAHLAPVAPSEDDQDGPWRDACTQLPHVLTERFFAVAQQLPWHIFCRIVSGLERGQGPTY